jgi:hypothetical protein
LEMQALLRLGGWGAAAVAALLLAVVAAHSTTGQQRFAGAIASMSGKGSAQTSEAAMKAQLARLADNETQTRRLAEMVRALGNDRERLLARLTELERNLDDVTGSIKVQAVLPSANPPADQLTAAPANPTEQPAPPAATQAQPPDRVAAVPARDPPEMETARPPIGVDIGGAPNFDGLRTLWRSAKSSQVDLLDGLRPLVSVRENAKRGADLRLIVGPLPDSGAAARICAELAGAIRYCRLADFEGRPLPLVARETPKRQKAERRAARPANN